MIDIQGLAGSMNPGKIMDIVKDVDFPIGKDDLVAVLKQKNADGKVVEGVEKSDKEKFDSPNDVMGVVSGFLDK